MCVCVCFFFAGLLACRESVRVGKVKQLCKRLLNDFFNCKPVFGANYLGLV